MLSLRDLGAKLQTPANGAAPREVDMATLYAVLFELCVARTGAYTLQASRPKA